MKLRNLKSMSKDQEELVTKVTLALRFVSQRAEIYPQHFSRRLTGGTSATSAILTLLAILKLPVYKKPSSTYRRSIQQGRRH